MTTGIILGAIAAALLVAKKKWISGIGAVSQESIDYGANNLYIEIMNTEYLYRKYGELAFNKLDQGISPVKAIEFMLRKDIKAGRFYKNRGMSYGAEARQKAAQDIADAFTWDWEHGHQY